MGLPEPIEPNPDDDAPESRRENRADWLCGPEEGLDAELQRQDLHAAPAPRLFRPGADTPSEPSAPAPRRAGPDLPAPRLTLPSAPETSAGEAAPRVTPGVPLPKRAPGAVQAEEPGGFSHGPAMLWEPGANSVPVLPRDSAAPARPSAQPSAQVPDLDFPMDDAEERARATAAAAAAAAAAAEAATERAAQPHAVVAPEAFDLKDAPAPWWMQVPQLLREDRRVQALAAVLAIAMLALVFWPRAEKSLSIGGIRRDAARYDGQTVRVSGRIGEIFEVGGGHAFYLHQGRDTLVVFSRSRTPRRGQRTTVVGMISTGYLNGQSGTALFETAKP